MTPEERIVEIFRRNVRGRRPVLTGTNVRHDGREGHWLESQFGVSANANNQSDLFGFELKDQTTSKTTFGDWSANVYIFTDPQYSALFRGSTKAKKQNSFLYIFGRPNPAKANRYSWSGTPCPKIERFNPYGQKLVVSCDDDICAIYSFSEDTRENKAEIVPAELQQENLVIARWYGRTSPSARRTDKCLREKLEDKFNQSGWFTCKKDATGAYCEICFGDPINYDNWIALVRQGIVFFDSGMYEGNARPYSQWRAENALWESLIRRRYS